MNPYWGEILSNFLSFCKCDDAACCLLGQNLILAFFSCSHVCCEWSAGWNIRVWHKWVNLFFSQAKNWTFVVGMQNIDWNCYLNLLFTSPWNASVSIHFFLFTGRWLSRPMNWSIDHLKPSIYSTILSTDFWCFIQWHT